MAEIIISNKMTARYTLKGYRESFVRFELLVGTYKDSNISFEIRPRVLGKKSLKFDLEVQRSGTYNLPFVIQPKIHNHLNFIIDVNPHNRMYAQYLLKEPPVHNWNVAPIQDSYVLSEYPYSSINYGANNSMIVGNGSRGEGMPFVQFDLSTLPRNIRIKSAKFRMNYSDLRNINLNLFRVKEPWREYNITFNNAPMDIEFLTSDYINDIVNRRVEFDITETAIGWFLGISNNGLCLTSPDSDTTIFRARESTQPPELYIEYYSDDPINSGISKMKFSILPTINKEKNLKFNIEIISHFRKSDMAFSILAHDYNHIYTSEMGFEIYASRDEAPFDITVMKIVNGLYPFEVSVAENMIDEIEFDLFVPSFDREVLLGFSITPQLSNITTLGFQIDSNRVYTSGDSNMLFDVYAQGLYQDRNSDMSFYISVAGLPVSREFRIPFDIYSSKQYIPKESAMQFEIVIGGTNSYLGFEIEALSEYTGTMQEIRFELYSQGKGILKDSLLPFEITSDTLVYKGVSNMQFDITPQFFSDTAMKFEVDALTDYTGTYTDMAFMLSIPSFVELDLPFSIYVKRDNMKFNIVVPYVADSDMRFEVDARKFIVSDKRFNITVGQTARKSYIYII